MNTVNGYKERTSDVGRVSGLRFGNKGNQRYYPQNRMGEFDRRGTGETLGGIRQEFSKNQRSASQGNWISFVEGGRTPEERIAILRALQSGLADKMYASAEELAINLLLPSDTFERVQVGITRFYPDGTSIPADRARAYPSNTYGRGTSIFLTDNVRQLKLLDNFIHEMAHHGQYEEWFGGYGIPIVAGSTQAPRDKIDFRSIITDEGSAEAAAREVSLHSDNKRLQDILFGDLDILRRSGISSYDYLTNSIAAREYLNREGWEADWTQDRFSGFRTGEVIDIIKNRAPSLEQQALARNAFVDDLLEYKIATGILGQAKFGLDTNEYKELVDLLSHNPNKWNEDKLRELLTNGVDKKS
jgi:hypothetical protein